MISVKIDKGVSTMTFAGSGLEIAAEICVIVHGLYGVRPRVGYCRSLCSCGET